MRKFSDECAWASNEVIRTPITDFLTNICKQEYKNFLNEDNTLRL